MNDGPFIPRVKFRHILCRHMQSLTQKPNGNASYRRAIIEIEQKIDYVEHSSAQWHHKADKTFGACVS